MKTRGPSRSASFSKSSAKRHPWARASTSAPVKQPGGKIVTAFAVRGDLDLDGTFSNTFTLEWPKGSGNVREYPEVDRAGWFPVDEARSKLLKGQRPLLDHLLDALEAGEPGGSR